MAKTKEEIMQGMDEAGVEAAKVLEVIAKKYPEAYKEFQTWHKENTMTAGYKRLGKAINNLVI